MPQVFTDIVSWLWPSHSMGVAVFFSIVAGITIASIDRLKQLQFVPVWVIVGAIIAFIYIFFTGNLQMAVAAFIWFIIPAPLVLILIFLFVALGPGVAYIWRRLGGE